MKWNRAKRRRRRGHYSFRGEFRRRGAKQQPVSTIGHHVCAHAKPKSLKRRSPTRQVLGLVELRKEKNEKNKIKWLMKRKERRHETGTIIRIQFFCSSSPYRIIYLLRLLPWFPNRLSSRLSLLLRCREKSRHFRPSPPKSFFRMILLNGARNTFGRSTIDPSCPSCPPASIIVKRRLVRPGKIQGIERVSTDKKKRKRKRMKR